MSLIKFLLAFTLVGFSLGLKTSILPQKILAVPVAWPSHVDDFKILCAELVKRGHAVTLVLNIPHVAVAKDCLSAQKRLQDSNAQVHCVHYNESRRDITVSPGQYTIFGAKPTVDIAQGDVVADAEKLSKAGPVTTLRTVVGYNLDRLGLLMRDKEFLEHVSTTQYDIFLSDFMDFGAGILADHLNIPRVELQTGGTIPWAFYLFHNMLYSPAYVPSVGMTDLRPNYDFLKRLNNFARLGALTFMRSTMVIPMVNAARREHNVPQRRPHTSGFQSEGMLIISLGEPAWNPSYPVPPNVKIVGQFVEETAMTPLTPEMEVFFLNEAEPVVVISEGSILSWEDNELATLLSALYSVQPPVRVLCKLLSARRERMQDAGVNWELYESSGRFVFLSWIPQAAALAHPNTKLMVSHCGMHGIREALEHSVTILCIPILGNQLENTELVAFHGVGYHLKRSLLKADDVNATMMVLKKGLECSTCRAKASALSKRMSWHSTPPVAQAADWLEYIAMTSNGEAFLVPHGYHLPWYIATCMDIMAVLVVTFLGAAFVSYRCIRHLLSSSSFIWMGKAKAD